MAKPVPTTDAEIPETAAYFPTIQRLRGTPWPADGTFYEMLFWLAAHYPPKPKSEPSDAAAESAATVANLAAPHDVPTRERPRGISPKGTRKNVAH